MPDLEKISHAYDIPYVCIETEQEIVQKVSKVMNMEGPVLCRIVGSLWFDEIPKCISKIDEQTGKRVSALLENPYPYLSSEEMRSITANLLTDAI